MIKDTTEVIDDDTERQKLLFKNEHSNQQAL